MPNQKISELTAIVTVDNSVDVLPIVDISANTTKKVTPNALKTALALDNVNNTSDANKPVSIAQQDALNAKVDENAPIVAATKTKITYDAKGLVTAGDILDAADMPTGINAANIGAGAVSSTEFGYLDGVTSAIQTQLNGKQATLVSGTNIKTINGATVLGAGDITIAGNPPSGVAGAIQFSNGSAFASDAANLFWDDTNNRLGIGTNAPSNPFEIYHTTNYGVAYIKAATALASIGNGSGWRVLNAAGNSSVWLQNTNASVGIVSSDSALAIGAGSTEAIRITTNTNVNVNATTDLGAKLGIKGSGSTSATTSLLVQNSAGVNSLQVKDDGSVFNYGKGAFGTNNIFGDSAFKANTTGEYNSAFGVIALEKNTTGLFNSAFGFQALNNNTSGASNTAVGMQALNGVTSQSNNTAVGFQCLNDGGANNSALGATAASGGFSGSVILGRGATATASNQFVVGSSTTNAGAIDSSAFTQDKRWKVKINGVDYYIALQTA